MTSVCQENDDHVRGSASAAAAAAATQGYWIPHCLIAAVSLVTDWRQEQSTHEILWHSLIGCLTLHPYSQTKQEALLHMSQYSPYVYRQHMDNGLFRRLKSHGSNIGGHRSNHSTGIIETPSTLICYLHASRQGSLRGKPRLQPLLEQISSLRPHFIRWSLTSLTTYAYISLDMAITVVLLPALMNRVWPYIFMIHDHGINVCMTEQISNVPSAAEKHAYS